MADDRMQALVDFQPDGRDRIGDLPGVRAIRDPASQRCRPVTTFWSLHWHGDLSVWFGMLDGAVSLMPSWQSGNQAAR